VIAAALDVAARALGWLPASPLVPWAAAHRVGWRDRALLATYPQFGGSYPLAMLAGTVVVDGIGAKLDYLRGLVLPDRQYRSARLVAGRRPEWRLLLQGLAWGRGRQ
jgi:hypothetical protein